MGRPEQCGQSHCTRSNHKLRPRWDGPFTVTACPSPNAYTLVLLLKMRCIPTVNVDRLKPFFERADESPFPGPVSDAGQAGKHEVDLLLNRRVVLVIHSTEYLGASPRLPQCRCLTAGIGAGQLLQHGDGGRGHRAQPLCGPLRCSPGRPSGPVVYYFPQSESGASWNSSGCLLLDPASHGPAGRWVPLLLSCR